MSSESSFTALIILLPIFLSWVSHAFFFFLCTLLIGVTETVEGSNVTFFQVFWVVVDEEFWCDSVVHDVAVFANGNQTYLVERNISSVSSIASQSAVFLFTVFIVVALSICSSFELFVDAEDRSIAKSPHCVRRDALYHKEEEEREDFSFELFVDAEDRSIAKSPHCVRRDVLYHKEEEEREDFLFLAAPKSPKCSGHTRMYVSHRILFFSPIRKCDMFEIRAGISLVRMSLLVERNGGKNKMRKKKKRNPISGIPARTSLQLSRINSCRRLSSPAK
ncbi:hypothetical protein CDAR_520031 [Caerostris darwini]|uniref:Transmembrane protein n=1 Tax=Caerostris darwini TaxID=1538125 RepID=A0AAV4WR96_9ARAC|nr:hypothetical protein CDAR_520031 [Caerostris darwini]